MMRFWLTVCLLLTLAAPATAVDHGLGEQVLAEINLARTDPHAYAGFIRDFRSQFRGKYYLQPGSTTHVQTTEGVAAVDEAIKYLSRLKPLPPLAWSNGLAAAAAELAGEQEHSGATGHNGRKSHGMRERIERHGEWKGTIGENIGYGPEGARNIVIQLIVDDGVPGRGHRVNTFSGDYRTAGVTCGAHPHFGSMCVVDFAGGFRDR